MIRHLSVLVPRPPFGRFAVVENAVEAENHFSTFLSDQAARLGVPYKKSVISTRAAALQAIADVNDEFKGAGIDAASSLLVFSFLGHGVRCPADDAPAGDEREFLVCEDEALSDVDLRAALVTVEKMRLVLVLDACFAGGAVRSAASEFTIRAIRMEMTADLAAPILAPIPIPPRRFYPSGPQEKDPPFHTDAIQISAGDERILPGFTQTLADLIKRSPKIDYKRLGQQLQRKFKGAKVVPLARVRSQRSPGAKSVLENPIFTPYA